MTRRLFLLPFLLAIPAKSPAHHLAAPKVDLVHVGKGEIRVLVDYAVEPAKSGEMRAIFDGDRDGKIGAGSERAAAEAWLKAAATNFLVIHLDGTKVPLAVTESELRGLERGDLGALVVLSAKLALGAGPHRLTLADRHKDAEIEVPVRVTFARGISSDTPDTPVLLGRNAPLLAIDFHAQ